MPKTKHEIHQIQIWPSGRSVEYYGDYDAPVGHKDRGLRFSASCGGRMPARFKRGSAAEWAEVRVQERARMYDERDILACDSSLVGDLIKLNGVDPRGMGDASDLAEAFSFDQIENLYQDPNDWDAERCRAYGQEQGIKLPIRPTLGDSPQIDETADDDDSSHGYLTELREACQEHAQDTPAEVFEWWRVSEWLCDQLKGIGEVVIDNGYGCWWGRCCTGQGWIMDGTLQQVARAFEREG